MAVSNDPDTGPGEPTHPNVVLTHCLDGDGGLLAAFDAPHFDIVVRVDYTHCGRDTFDRVLSVDIAELLERELHANSSHLVDVRTIDPDAPKYRTGGVGVEEGEP